ncbi:GGDEF domain-containing response regulator [Desulfomicrobium escambiense]|uniref:GGDEF domain-containing response regulator n=1 Tax=Desulfomicrobium escambiense TaxID=29503 RepID=UPI001B7F9692|nr:diguanylate cyclase [Desulfomicrobium escambiense]
MMNTEKPRILIVDDEVFNLQFLTELLITDHHVSTAKDGPKALQLAQSLLPDLVILDVVMPGMDGYEVIQALKANRKTRHIPVIFLTGLDNARDEEKGLSLGALDYISKPFHPAIVKARVNNILELVQHRKLLEKIALIDGLTGVPNRRAYDERLQHEWHRACRSGEPFSLAFVDIDYFKQFNDTYGHAAGDLALKKVAQTLNSVLKRTSDFVARYGGEEFAFILPSISFQNAQAFATQACLEVHGMGLEHKASSAADVITISIGGATTLPARNQHLGAFTKHVDTMLYQAKEARNRAVWSFFQES